jgi:hypothetical protein
LKDQRELCLYMENDHNNTTGYQHYQSLPFNAPYEGLSFEEIRLADLKAGRMGPSQASTNPFLTNVSSSAFGGGGLFGRPTTYQRLVDHSKPGFSGATSTQDITVRPGTGLFRGLGTQTASAPTESGLFGGVRSEGTTQGALGRFGASSTAGTSTYGLFGGPRALSSNPPSTGLSGLTQTTTTGSLFGNSRAPAPAPTSTNVFNTTQSAPIGGLFGGFGAVNNNPPSLSLSNNTQPPPPASDLFGSAPPTSSLPVRPSLFGLAAAPANNPCPTNPFTGLQSSTRPRPSTDAAQPNGRRFRTLEPFSNARVTFRPGFSTTSTTAVTSPLNPRASNVRPLTSANPRAPNVRPLISASSQQRGVQAAQIYEAEPRSDGSEGGVPRQDARNVPLPDDEGWL